MPTRPTRQPPPIPADARRRVRPPAAVVRAAPPPVPTDALVTAARQGHRRAFDELVRRYRPRIIALALHLTGSRAEADDVTQDVFLRAWENLGDFEGRSAFFTWIYRIALNRSLQCRAARRARPMVDFSDPRVLFAVAVDASGAPHRALELREAYARLVCAFDQLSPLLRSTVALTTLQGMSYPEAAAVMNSTEGTIGWRMHEAKLQLRRALDAVEEDGAQKVAERSQRRARVKADESDERLSVSLAMALAAVF